MRGRDSLLLLHFLPSLFLSALILIAKDKDPSVKDDVAEAETSPLVRSIGIVTYVRLTLRFAAFVIAIVSIVLLSCWPYSIPLIATSTSHFMVSGHVFVQYKFLKETPNAQTLQDLSTAKTGENINTVLQTTLGLYFAATYFLKDPPFNKTKCSMMNPAQSELVLQIILIAFVVVQILDCIMAIVQYRFISSLKAKYKASHESDRPNYRTLEQDDKSRAVNRSDLSAKPVSNTNESAKQAEPPPPPTPINTTPSKASDVSVTGDGDNKAKEQEPLLVAAKIPVASVKSKPKEMASNPSCPSSMSFNEKDMGNLKEVEKELMDLLKNNEDPHSTKPVAKQPEPKKPSKARKKKNEEPKVVVDILDKTQLDSESDLNTQKTQASQTRTTRTKTNTLQTGTSNKSSETKVSI